LHRETAVSPNSRTAIDVPGDYTRYSAEFDRVETGARMLAAEAAVFGVVDEKGTTSV
jgi:hypothetical protein